MGDALFYVLSLKYTRHGMASLWWGPDRCGYVADLDRAGKYTAAEIAEHRLDDGVSTRAFPCALVDACARRTLPVDVAVELLRVPGVRPTWVDGSIKLLSEVQP